MSRENVEMVTRVWETFVTRDPKGMDYLAEDLVYEIGGRSVQAGAYHGHDGYLQLLRSWTEVWTEFSLDPREFIDGGGDKVIVVAHRSGRSRMTGLRFESDVFFVYDVRDGKLARIREVEDRAAAFRIVADETTG
jgi:ketosteroid isomerase-like protein